ncbi:hypothetical protein LZ30DRAFT_827742 [Colletotrichum cereale]|nr:hypothetical protein LZ30DRAFT_827742 [Colletotrichum cereale]
MRFTSAVILLATMAGVTLGAPAATSAGPVDARSASEMLSARDMNLIREIISGSEKFQGAVAKREVDDRAIPIYVIFTYNE